MFNFKISGIDEIQKQLKGMQESAKNLEGVHDVPLETLFNQSFMSANTQFDSLDEFLKSGNFIVESKEDFLAIPDEEMDSHVSDKTNFDNWEEMLDTATLDFASKKLGF